MNNKFGLSNLSKDDFFQKVREEENIKFTLTTIGKLSDDPVKSLIVSMLRERKLEIRSFLSWLSSQVKPKNYLEVGVRRGFSTAMVAARNPEVEIYAFDMWVKNYGTIKNPGPIFVKKELRKVDYQGNIHFINGNSHKTLMRFFDEKRNWMDTWIKRIPQAPNTFDLILVDGDHSILGAYQDLTEVMPHCAIGGVIIFDDIKPDIGNMSPDNLALVIKELGDDPYNWGSLMGVWERVKKEFLNFKYFDYLENSPGTGIGIRIS